MADDDQTDAHRYMMEGLRLGRASSSDRHFVPTPFREILAELLNYTWETVPDARLCRSHPERGDHIKLTATSFDPATQTLRYRCVLTPIEPPTNTPPNRETDPCD